MPSEVLMHKENVEGSVALYVLRTSHIIPSMTSECEEFQGPNFGVIFGDDLGFCSFGFFEDQSHAL